MDKYQKNFYKTLELIQTCFDLKEAYLKSKYPAASPEEIRKLVYQQILERKTKQWKPPHPF
jgi:hypothetical protein